MICCFEVKPIRIAEKAVCAFWNNFTRDIEMGNKESKPPTKPGTAAFDRWLNQRLQLYFEDLETMVLHVKVAPEAKKDIKEAVDEMIVNIFKEVEKIDARLKIKKSGLLKTGDFYEDTQVICLDEIEIYAVLENMSGEEVIHVENTTDEYFETQHVCVNQNFISQYEEFMVNDDINQGLLSGNKLVSHVYGVMETAVEQMRKQSKDVVYKKHGYLELLDDSGISKRGCSICFKFDWTGNIFFSVIVTPVLKINKTESNILHEEVLSELVFEAISACGSLLLVPEKGSGIDSYFRLSLAHAECYLMNKEVSASHRRVYRILQFLINGYNKKETGNHQLLRNEHVKTFVIMHDATCDKKNAIGQCVMAIIIKMAELLEGAASDEGKLFLASIFVKHMNTFRRTAAMAEKDIVNLNLSAISRLKEHLVDDIGRTPSYFFSDVISKLVPVNQFILNADYHARKSRVDLLEDGTESPAL